MSEQTISESVVRTPWHLWVIGVISLLWSAMGAFEYAITQSRSDWFLAQFTPEQLEYFYGFPIWADAAWALGVWGLVPGSLALLLRRNWAVWLFGISIVGLVFTTTYNFVLTNGAERMGGAAAASTFSILIWAIMIALFLYARRMAGSGVLR